MSSLEKWIGLEPSNRRAWLLQGRIHWEANAYEMALESWQRGQKLFPEDQEFRYWILEAMDRLGWLDSNGTP